MKILPTVCIKDLDAYTIEHEPIASIDLMERAAKALVEAITERYSTDTPFTVFAGPGNNGGDALAVARLMAEKGYRMDVYLFNPKGELSEDCSWNMELLLEMKEINFYIVTSKFTPPVLTEERVVIDGLFGSGLNKPLVGGFAAVVKLINAAPSKVISIDVPSGLMGENNTYNTLDTIVRANLTLSLQLPKLAFFFAENEAYVGEWQLLDIGLSETGLAEMETDYELLEHEEMEELLKPRGRFAHKGNFGRALLIAGSQGMAGASILAARACLRSGVGLLTVHVPFCNNFMLQTSVPEAMTSLDYSDVCFSTAIDADNYQAVAVGPGLGKRSETEAALLEQIETTIAPMVLDADALNLLAEKRSYLSRLPKGSILTPHPKELERLVGRCENSYERLMKARELAQTAQVCVVLKGAFTAVIAPSGKVSFNNTGNPGMAKGGSGDVLTGILLALLAQGYDSLTAARLGVYVHGLAGDLAANKQGEMGMTPSDMLACLPQIWKNL